MAEKNLIEMGWSQTAVKKQLQNDSCYEGLLQQDMPHTDYESVLERMSMMQAWADYLESLKEGGNRVSMYGAILIKKNANEGA